MRAWGAGGILLGYCVLISAVVLFLRWVRTDPAAAWFLAQGLLLLAPVSNIVPTVTQTVAPYRAGCSGLAASALTGWAAVTVGRWAWRAGRRSRSRWLFVLAPAFGIWCVGLVVWGAGRWRDALTVSSTVECYDRDSTFGAIEMAAALIDAGRLEPALARLDRLAARAVAPTAEEAKQTANLAWTDRAYLSDWLAELYGRAGLLLVQRGEQIHAYGVLREGAALSPNNLYVNIGLANYSVAVRDLSAAGSYLRMVLQSHPEMTEKRIVLGRILGAQGRWAEAAEEFQTALLHEPTQPRAYILSANALLRIGQRGRARAILDSGIRRSVLDAAKVNAWLAQDGAGR